MIKITFQFEDAKAVDTTLLAALGELPAKLAFHLIAQTHAQIREQVEAEKAEVDELAKLRASKQPLLSAEDRKELQA